MYYHHHMYYHQDHYVLVLQNEDVLRMLNLSVWILSTIVILWKLYICTILQ